MSNYANINAAVQIFIKELDKDQQPSSENILREPSATFERNISYRQFLKSPMLIVQSIRHGVPWFLFEEIQNQSLFTEEEWADFLNISTKSLQRYKAAQNHIFKPIHSEKIFELAEVTELGKEVFGDAQKFYRWLGAPNVALGGHKPSDLIHNSYGKELVLDELYRIDQGIFA